MPSTVTGLSPVTLVSPGVLHTVGLGPGHEHCLSEHLRNLSNPPSLKHKPSEQLLIISLVIALNMQDLKNGMRENHPPNDQLW